MGNVCFPRKVSLAQQRKTDRLHGLHLLPVVPQFDFEMAAVFKAINRTRLSGVKSTRLLGYILVMAVFTKIQFLKQATRVIVYEWKYILFSYNRESCE